MEAVNGVDVPRDVLLDDEIIGESPDPMVHAVQLIGVRRPEYFRGVSLRANRVGFEPPDVVIRFQDAREGEMSAHVLRGLECSRHDRSGYWKGEARSEPGKSCLVHEVFHQVGLGEQEAVISREVFAIP